MRRRERELYERLLAEKDRLVVALSDEVDWHRANSGTYLQRPAPDTVFEPDEASIAFEQVLESARIGGAREHLSEDEEEILWNLRHGGLTPETAQSALAAITGVDGLDFDAL